MIVACYNHHACVLGLMSTSDAAAHLLKDNDRS